MKRKPKRYLNKPGLEFVRMTYMPSEGPKPVSVWAEVGPVSDGLVQLFWEVDAYAKRLAAIHVLVGSVITKPAKLNIDTWKLERVWT